MVRTQLRRHIAIVLPVILVFFASFVLVHAQAQGGGTQIANPVKFPDIASFIAGALKALVMVALPIITLFVVYAGFMFVTAQGKPEKLNKAKENFVYVVIGALLIMGAWVIATLIGGTVSQLTNGL